MQRNKFACEIDDYKLHGYFFVYAHFRKHARYFYNSKFVSPIPFFFKILNKHAKNNGDKNNYISISCIFMIIPRHCTFCWIYKHIFLFSQVSDLDKQSVIFENERKKQFEIVTEFFTNPLFFQILKKSGCSRISFLKQFGFLFFLGGGARNVNIPGTTSSV